MAKRLLCVVLSLLMIMAVLPMGVVADGNEAKVGDTEYSTLSEAISAASDDDTVTLLSDVSLSSALTISSDITLDLGGYTIYASSSSTKITLSGTITITNGTINGGTCFTSITNVYNNNSMVTVSSGAVVTSNNVNFTGTYGYLNMLSVYGTMTINGGTISSRCIYLMSGCDLTINDGTTIDATAANGTIYYNAFTMYLGSTITINGGTIKSTLQTFAKYAQGTSSTEVPTWKITINGGTFLVNENDLQSSAQGNSSYPDYHRIMSTTAYNGVKTYGDVTITGGTFNQALALGDSYKGADGKTYYDAIDESFYEEVLGEDYESAITENTDGTYTIGATEEVPELYGRTLVVGTKIGVKYYYTLDESLTYTDYTIKYTIDGDSNTYETSLTPYSGNYYTATCYVSFYQMARDITVTVYKGDEPIDSTTTSGYSVRQYYVNVYKDKEESTTKTLLQAMLNYGSYGQTYIGDTSTLANNELEIDSLVSAVTADDLQCFGRTKEKSSDELSYVIKPSVLVSSTESVQLKFEFENVDGCTITINGEAISGTSYTTDDIYVQDWDTFLTIKIVDGEDSLTLKYCVLSYAYDALTTTYDDDADETEIANRQNLVKAMYLYNKAADAYLNSQG